MPRSPIRLLLPIVLIASCSLTQAIPKPVWTTRQIRELPKEQARIGQTVRFTAVVTYVFSISYPAIIVSDETGALFAYSEIPLYCQPGDVLDIEGVTDGGYFAPSVHILRAVPTSAAIRPKPSVEGRVGQMMMGRLDCQSVWLNGVVKSVVTNTSTPHSFQLALRTPEGTVPVCLSFLRQESDSACQLLYSLVDCEVRVEGVCCTIFNSRGEWRGAIVNLNDLRQISTLKQSPSDPFAAPETDITAIKPYAPDGPTLHRRRITGIVSVVQSERCFYLQRNGRGICVELAGGPPPVVGTTIEVSGFPTLSGSFAGIESAVYRSLPGLPHHLTPLRISLKDIFSPLGNIPFRDNHARLVTLRGAYRGSMAQGTQHGFYIESEGYLLPVYGRETAFDLPVFAEGTELEVTGVALIDDKEPGPLFDFPKAKSFSLVLRSPSDAVILRRAPWWTIRRLSVALGGMFVTIVAILLWNRTLYRRVEARTQELIATREVQLAEQLRSEERARIAGELHDTIAQSLAGIGMQLQTAKAVLPRLPKKALSCIQSAVSVVALTRQDLRHAVWNLRSRALADGDLTRAVQEMVDHLALTGRVQFHIDLGRFPSSIPRVEIAQIFSVVREAVTNAVRHGAATEIVIRADVDENSYRIVIQDNGTGFDVSGCKGVESGHFGLAGMKERMRRFEAEVCIESHLGKGTCVCVSRKCGRLENTE